MSLSEKVFQGPKVVVKRFGWNLAQKLGVIRYFKTHFSSLLCSGVTGGGVSHFLPFEHQKSSLPGNILKVPQDPTGKLYCQINLTMNSTIIGLSVYAWNFVLKALHREENRELVLIQRWALIKFLQFSASVVFSFATIQLMLTTKHEEVTKQGFCKILWRKLCTRGSLLLLLRGIHCHSSGWVWVLIYLSLICEEERVGVRSFARLAAH